MLILASWPPTETLGYVSSESKLREPAVAVAACALAFDVAENLERIGLACRYRPKVFASQFDVGEALGSFMTGALR